MLRRRFSVVILLFATMSAGILAGTAGTAFAGKAPPTTSTISIDQPTPQLGQYVTFNVTGVDKIKSPRIAVRCYQNGVMGYAEAGPYTQAFLLGGGASAWLANGGPANCSAELFYFVWNGNNVQQVFSLATIPFNAAG